MKAISLLSILALASLLPAQPASAVGVDVRDGCVWLVLSTGEFEILCVDDVDPMCDGWWSDYPCYDPSDRCIRFSAGSGVCEPDPICGSGEYPCVQVGGGICIHYTPTLKSCASDAQEAVCDSTPKYPCWDGASRCVRTSPTASVCPLGVVPQCPPTCNPVTVDCSGAGCAPTTSPTSMDPYRREVALAPQTAGHATTVPGQTVNVPSVTVVPGRGPTTVTVPVPYVPPQAIVVPEQGVGPFPAQRVCAPNEYVCYTTPNVPGVEVGPYDLGDTPGVGGPVPVTVPGNGPVATPAQTVGTPSVPVDAFVTVGASVWFGWTGGSVGPVNQAGLEVCAQGCPSPGQPSYGVEKTVVLP